MYKQILVFISLILLLSACRKRTQEIETEFNFIKHKYHYNLELGDTAIYTDYGLLYYEESSYSKYEKENFIYREVVYEPHQGTINPSNIYDMNISRGIIITGGGIFVGGDCVGALFRTNKKIIYLPFITDNIKEKIKVKACDLNIELELMSNSTIINVPSIGDIETKVLFNSVQGRSVGTLYYYNKDYLIVKIVEKYDKYSKKGAYSFTLNRVE